MENLNAENIVNEIQSLIKALKDCGGWVERGNGEGWFNHEILADALALITSQEQRIAELTEQRDRCELTILECENEIKRLTEENERLKLDVEACGAELSRYTERLKARNAVYCTNENDLKEMNFVVDQIAKEMLEGDNERT